MRGKKNFHSTLNKKFAHQTIKEDPKRLLVRKFRLVVAVSSLVASGSASAQSSVSLYGIIDAGVMYSNNVAKAGSRGALLQATSGGVNGSRFGFRGGEELGGGLKAVYLLESGFNVETGRFSQTGLGFGRQAYVGVSSSTYGAIRFGRQYDSLIDFVSPLSSTAGTFGDAGFAHPFDNDNLIHSVRMNNSVKYSSGNVSGLKLGTLYAFSNNVDFSLNRAYSFGASYGRGPLNMAAAYLQINGSNSITNTNGAIEVAESGANGTGGFQLSASRVRVYGAGVNYKFGPSVVGFVYTRSVYQGTESFNSANGTMSFNNYEVNAKFQITRAINLGLAGTYTDGHVANSGTFGADPKFNQINIQTVYALSKLTDVYAEAMYQHAIGSNYVAFITTAGGASSTSNQVVGTIGIRTRF